MKKLFKVFLFIFIGTAFLVFNGWHLFNSFGAPEYYQKNNISSSDIAKFQRNFNIHFPDKTRFIKAEEYLTSLGGDDSIKLYISVPSNLIKQLFADYSSLPIHYNDTNFIDYGVNITKSKGSDTYITLQTADDKGYIFDIKKDPEWSYKGVTGTQYLTTTILYNALFILIIYVCNKMYRKHKS
ncbi:MULTISPECIES: hypothetical protein [Bacillus]|uniref:hypothetical protein n=1 Tax=Bacillus TaxID=1386 RepID=UPI00025B2308|nr:MULTISPECIES: hypothetical protein [Bacillus]EIF13313.1 hypothetical protein MY7_1637 [Bacillus sp. 5B6]MEC0952476.1 hypothetical protein [Bacillus velezensis]MED3707074.1 hypothetical protein [Bacillus velezensis]QGI72384.1 hypothetical protein GI367_04905 [Bacillus velezensis]QNE07932.1 hypothetical protein H5405_10445 [Bacillus velezensis]